MKITKHASVFSGIEGFGLAALWAGIETVFSCEINGFCREVIKRNFPKTTIYEDIRSTDFRQYRGKIDILTGGFPCFVAGTPVLTSGGFKNIEDVKVGDFVLSTDRNYNEVECLMTHVADSIVYMRAQGMFEELKCTPNHPFYTRRRKVYYKNRKRVVEFDKPEYIPAGEIKKGDRVGYPIHEGIDKTLTPSFWKLVGTWIADGWIDNSPRKERKNSRNHKVIICCGKDNVKRLCDTIQKAGYKYTLSEDKNTYKAIICNELLCNFFMEFGMYVHGRRLSPKCFKLDHERKKALFEGWMFDGHIEKNGSFKVTTVSKELAMGMAQIARDVYKCPVSISKKTTNRTCIIECRTANERPQYCVTIRNSERYGFYEDGFIWCNIKSIKSKKERNQVFNLSVNEENSYNVYGIAVHNCQPFSVAGQRKGSGDDRYLWPEMLRVIDEVRPTWVIGENVAGITSMVQPGEVISVENHSDLFGEDNYSIETERAEYVIETVCRDLEGIGYSVQPFIIPACAVGAPHRRDRIWIVANSNSQRCKDEQEGQKQVVCDGIWDCSASEQQVGEQQRGTCKYDGASTDSGLLGQTERQEQTMGTIQLCEECNVTNTPNTGVENMQREWENGVRKNGYTSDPKEQRLSVGYGKSPQNKAYTTIERHNSIPDWKNFPTVSPIHTRNDGVSSELLRQRIREDSMGLLSEKEIDKIFSKANTKLREEGVKASGNAIVPQVAYQIIKAIVNIVKT